MIYLFLAPGFEEVEALAPLDLLRRGGLTVTTVAIRPPLAPQDSHSTAVTGAHGITVLADIPEEDFPAHLAAQPGLEAVILPGGMPGTTHLDASPTVELALEQAVAQEAYLCAICAAPLILGKRGLLRGKQATCFPGFEDLLKGATVGGKVIRDGRIVTAAGMGVAQEFGLELLSLLASPQKAGEIRQAIQAL